MNKKPDGTRRYRRTPGRASQVLLDAALDTLGILCLLLLLSGFFHIALDGTWAVLLAVAGVDVIFRTSVRDLAGRAVRALGRAAAGLFRRKRRARTEVEAEALPDPGLPI